MTNRNEFADIFGDRLAQLPPPPIPKILSVVPPSNSEGRTVIVPASRAARLADPSVESFRPTVSEKYIKRIEGENPSAGKIRDLLSELTEISAQDVHLTFYEGMLGALASANAARENLKADPSLDPAQFEEVFDKEKKTIALVQGNPQMEKALRDYGKIDLAFTLGAAPLNFLTEVLDGLEKSPPCFETFIKIADATYFFLLKLVNLSREDSDSLIEFSNSPKYKKLIHIGMINFLHLTNNFSGQNFDFSKPLLKSALGNLERIVHKMKGIVGLIYQLNEVDEVKFVPGFLTLYTELPKNLALLQRILTEAELFFSVIFASDHKSKFSDAVMAVLEEEGNDSGLDSSRECYRLAKEAFSALPEKHCIRGNSLLEQIDSYFQLLSRLPKDQMPTTEKRLALRVAAEKLKGEESAPESDQPTESSHVGREHFPSIVIASLE